MSSRVHIHSALLALGLYVICILLVAQPGDCQHVPARCVCHNPKLEVRRELSDLEVYLKRPGCDKDEIIVTLKKTGQKVCLSPDGNQGKRLLRCWHEMQKKKGDVKQCLKRRKQRSQRKHTRSKKKTS